MSKMKTLTPQILGMYIGHKYQYWSKEFERHMGGRVSGLTISRFEMEDYHDEHSSYKLILRRLSDMTEEEYATVSRMAGTEKDFAFESAQGKALLTDYINSSRCNVTGQTWINIGDYLRLIGVDCDNLIDSGLAVEKK